MIPVSWDRLDRAPTPEARKAVGWSNDAVLHFLLHGIDVDAALRPSDEKLSEALAPLHAKLDIVIEMLGRLSYRDVQLPPRREVEFGLTQLAWFAPLPLPLGSWLQIKLFLHQTYLEPIVLHAEVTTCSAVQSEAGYRVEVQLTEVEGATGEAITRLAYLAQRRQLGQRASVPETARWDR